MVIERFGINLEENRYDQQAIYSLGLLYNRIYSELSNFLTPHGLTLGKFNILMIVKNHGKEEGIPQVEVSQRLIVTASNMTKMVDKLEKDDLVKRFALENDRRVNMVKITGKGAKLLDSIWPEFDKKLRSLLERFSENDQRQLASLLIGWFQSLD